MAMPLCHDDLVDDVVGSTMRCPTFPVHEVSILTCFFSQLPRFRGALLQSIEVGTRWAPYNPSCPFIRLFIGVTTPFTSGRAHLAG